MKIHCPCGMAYRFHVFEKDVKTGCATKEGFYLSCTCIRDHRVACIDERIYSEVTENGYKWLIRERINELLKEKTQVLYEQGIWPWNKKANRMHKEINLKLETLGVYQGKK